MKITFPKIDKPGPDILPPLRWLRDQIAEGVPVQVNVVLADGAGGRDCRDFTQQLESLVDMIERYGGTAWADAIIADFESDEDAVYFRLKHGV